MSKIKIDVLPIKNKIIKYNGSKFNLRPYISATDIEIINDLCVKEFLKNIDKDEGIFTNFPHIRIKFDIIVLNTCTDIDFEGWTYDSVISSRLMQIIRENIFNYEEVFNLITKNIELLNVTNYLKNIALALPSEEKMKANISELNKAMNDFTKDNPDLVKKVVESTLVANAIEKSKTETVQNLKEKKEENLKKLEALQKELDKKSKAKKGKK